MTKAIFFDFQGVLIDPRMISGILPPMKELVQKFAPDHLLFVISAGGKDTISRALEAENILEHFREVIGDPPEDSKEHKMKNILETFSITPDKAVFITDTSTDILEANYAGVKSVGVTWGLHDQELLATTNPHKIVNDAAELEDAIRELLQ